MVRLFAVAMVCVASTAPGLATACQRLEPSFQSLDGYTSVFIGRITGVHLAGYEHRLLGEPDAVVPGLGGLTITDGASPVTVRAVVSRSIRGHSTGAVELSLAGCTYDPPALKDEAIFFVQPGGSAIVVARREHESAFAEWLARLGATQDDR